MMRSSESRSTSPCAANAVVSSGYPIAINVAMPPPPVRSSAAGTPYGRTSGRVRAFDAKGRSACLGSKLTTNGLSPATRVRTTRGRLGSAVPVMDGGSDVGPGLTPAAPRTARDPAGPGAASRRLQLRAGGGAGAARPGRRPATALRPPRRQRRRPGHGRHRARRVGKVDAARVLAGGRGAGRERGLAEHGRGRQQSGTAVALPVRRPRAHRTPAGGAGRPPRPRRPGARPRRAAAADDPGAGRRPLPDRSRRRRVGGGVGARAVAGAPRVVRPGPPAVPAVPAAAQRRADRRDRRRPRVHRRGGARTRAAARRSAAGPRGAGSARAHRGLGRRAHSGAARAGRRGRRSRARHRGLLPGRGAGDPVRGRPDVPAAHQRSGPADRRDRRRGHRPSGRWPADRRARPRRGLPARGTGFPHVPVPSDVPRLPAARGRGARSAATWPTCTCGPRGGTRPTGNP